MAIIIIIIRKWVGQKYHMQLRFKNQGQNWAQNQCKIKMRQILGSTKRFKVYIFKLRDLV